MCHRGIAGASCRVRPAEHVLQLASAGLDSMPGGVPRAVYVSMHPSIIAGVLTLLLSIAAFLVALLVMRIAESMGDEKPAELPMCRVVSES